MATDLVTQLQDQVNHLATLYYNTAGALYNGAPPVAVADEPAPPPHAGALDVKEATGHMASALVAAHAKVDELAAALPPMGTEEEAAARVAQLQKDNDAVAVELERELAAADAELARVRKLFAAVTDAVLVQTSAGAEPGAPR